MTSFIVASPQACIGCRTCEVACALSHVAEGAPEGDASRTSQRTGDVSSM